MTEHPTLTITQTHVICPKHGTHAHTITSNIEGHSGNWCQICWLEQLGEPLPTVEVAQ